KEKEKERVLSKLVSRRAEGEPLQYILGNTDFGPLTLLCRPPTLIPRPETAHIFTEFATRLHRPLRILDLCTGSGCISFLLAWELSNLSPSKTSQNIRPKSISSLQADFHPSHELDMLHGRKRVRIYEDIEKTIPTDGEEIGGKVDVIVSNPPYLSQEEYDHLPRSVKGYEDPLALLGDADGLAFYNRIKELLPDLLSITFHGPRVGLEIGHGQGELVRGIFEEKGWKTELVKDQWDQDRMII
ncbi:hypothetical protein TREMEDRAFT_17674, partial [Tremella mesenterica DSM 1558]|uniref:uncharacterized protein n=1 Tax=Tremella mesenterica (strain ATCC 24925 / CBS 8224 / DSM 1558 / NBRC 9311 / NRRL Y-6157 / RJB 2259-6 / UBC 559-6) TaxID=578456 RepID=UPI00032C6D0C